MGQMHLGGCRLDSLERLDLLILSLDERRELLQGVLPELDAVLLGDYLKVLGEQEIWNQSLSRTFECIPRPLTCTRISVFEDVMYPDLDLTFPVGVWINILVQYVMASILFILCAPRMSLIRPRPVPGTYRSALVKTKGGRTSPTTKRSGASHCTARGALSLLQIWKFPVSRHDPSVMTKSNNLVLEH